MARFSWLDGKFVGKELAKGALNAVGGIIIYALAMWVILSNVLGARETATIHQAIQMRTPGLAMAQDTSARGAPVS
jgi:hypothetical protein